MLMEQLFATGIMRMGPSRVDPGRQVGVFNPAAVAGLPALRSAELNQFRWVAGAWSYENWVPSTPASPAYTDAGSARFRFNEKSNWICMVAPDGEEIPQITFDPLSRQWIYLLTKVILRHAALGGGLEGRHNRVYRFDDHDRHQYGMADDVDPPGLGPVRLCQRGTRSGRGLGLYRRVAVRGQS
jgi:hypothetical protein